MGRNHGNCQYAPTVGNGTNVKIRSSAINSGVCRLSPGIFCRLLRIQRETSYDNGTLDAEPVFQHFEDFMTHPTYHNLIGGEWLPAANGKTTLNLNPANHSDVVGAFPSSHAED